MKSKWVLLLSFLFWFGNIPKASALLAVRAAKYAPTTMKNFKWSSFREFSRFKYTRPFYQAPKMTYPTSKIVVPIVTVPTVISSGKRANKWTGSLIKQDTYSFPKEIVPKNGVTALQSSSVLVIDEPIFEDHPALVGKLAGISKTYRNQSFKRLAALEEAKNLEAMEHSSYVASVIAQGSEDIKILPGLNGPRSIYQAVRRAYRQGCRIVNLSQTPSLMQTDLTKYPTDAVQPLTEEFPAPLVSMMVQFLESEVNLSFGVEKVTQEFLNDHVRAFGELLKGEDIEAIMPRFGGLETESFELLQALKVIAETKLIQDYERTGVEYLRRAIEDHPEMLFVVAAGNDSRNLDFPSPGREGIIQKSHYPNVIVVASSDAKGELSSFSNFGSSTVHLAARGEKLRVLNSAGKVKRISGTSFSAPVVARVLAELKAKYPNLKSLELVDILKSTVSKQSHLTDHLAWGGILDEKAALKLADEMAAKNRGLLESFFSIFK